jgi:hypothetical protein
MPVDDSWQTCYQCRKPVQRVMAVVVEVMPGLYKPCHLGCHAAAYRLSSIRYLQYALENLKHEPV